MGPQKGYIRVPRRTGRQEKRSLQLSASRRTGLSGSKGEDCSREREEPRVSNQPGPQGAASAPRTWSFRWGWDCGRRDNWLRSGSRPCNSGLFALYRVADAKPLETRKWAGLWSHFHVRKMTLKAKQFCLETATFQTWDAAWSGSRHGKKRRGEGHLCCKM